MNSYGVSTGVWLGLTDEFEEGNWQWVTGEPLNYTNWYDGEPNNNGGLEHYAEFGHGKTVSGMTMLMIF